MQQDHKNHQPREGHYPVAIGDMFDTEGTDARRSHDAYRVFVNGEYVGDKSVVSDRDGEVQAIDSFLHEHGFDQHSISTQEHEINIVTPPDLQHLAHDLKNTLQGYLDLH